MQGIIYPVSYRKMLSRNYQIAVQNQRCIANFFTRTIVFYNQENSQPSQVRHKMSTLNYTLLCYFQPWHFMIDSLEQRVHSLYGYENKCLPVDNFGSIIFFDKLHFFGYFLVNQVYLAHNNNFY